MKTLKDMAIQCGFDVPLYTITGWNGPGIVDFPEYEFIPLFGRYADAPWVQNTDPLMPSANFNFVSGRNDQIIGIDQIKGGKCTGVEEILMDYPYASCEIGPGIQPTHHRRPLIEPYDLYAISIVMLGKGNNLPGYYVFHGGRKYGR